MLSVSQVYHIFEKKDIYLIDFYKKNQYYTTIDFKRYISTEDNSCRDESTKDERSLMRLV